MYTVINYLFTYLLTYLRMEDKKAKKREMRKDDRGKM